jgi:hypothetical protein
MGENINRPRFARVVKERQLASLKLLEVQL